MVRVLEDFRNHFRDRSDAYVLIGGAACDIWLSGNGLHARTTKDLDLVLVVEALNPEFSRLFWDYIEMRGYSCSQSESGFRRYYRFVEPESQSAPKILELFSRKDNALGPERTRIRRISFPEAERSLSAILMDDTYYRIVLSEARNENGLRLLSPLGLIVLKAKAYLDLRDRRDGGEAVDDRDIKKHKTDVLRMLAILDPGARLNVEDPVHSDLRRFVRDWRKKPVDWRSFSRNLGIPSEGVQDRLYTLFCDSFGVSSEG